MSYKVPLCILVFLFSNLCSAQRDQYLADGEKKFRWHGYINDPGDDSVLTDSDFGRLQLDSIDIIIITRNANIKKIDINWDKYRSLRTIDINCYSLLEFPTGISQAKQLQEIYLDFYYFHFFPDEIYSLEKLNWLTFYCSNLDTIGSEIGKLHQLKSLRINNRFGYAGWLKGTYVSSSVFTIKQLEFLDVAGWTDSISTSGIEFNNLKLLSIGIKKLNANISSFENITNLTLYLYGLNSMPFEISDFSALKSLSILGNVPNNLKFDSETIESVSIIDCKMDAFPDDLSRMKKLKYLYFHHVKIYLSPDVILFPQTLEEIYFNIEDKNVSIARELQLKYPEIKTREGLICF